MCLIRMLQERSRWVNFQDKRSQTLARQLAKKFTQSSGSRSKTESFFLVYAIVISNLEPASNWGMSGAQ